MEQQDLAVMEQFVSHTLKAKETMAIIKALMFSDKSVRDIAKEFDVSTAYIYNVKKKYGC